MFGCGAGLDCLQHFARCRVVRGLVATWWPFEVPAGQEFDVFLCMDTSYDEESVGRWGSILYGLYQVHNKVRCNGLAASDFHGAFRRLVLDSMR